jgi:uncharacterized membrane protein
MAVVWAATFGYLSVVRHLAGGSHAEDLGFTDQVLWNFLRGQWFRMSLYQGAATWNTELDLSHIARPDSLLAFHAEPMLLLFVPMYAVGAGATALLIVQAVAVAAGAIPAYRLGHHLSDSAICGVAVSAAYLLSPLGQWAVLADFHTSTLAAPLLLFSLERLIVGRAPRQALLLAALACSAREDVGPAVACIGVALLLTRERKTIGPARQRIGLAYLALGTLWTILALLVIRSYSGAFSPFSVRYTLDLAALARPTVTAYATTLLLSGGWLGLLAPLALLPALPSLALNVLSTSPWMAAGQAHYSSLVLPFVTLGAAAGLSRFRSHARTAAALALVATTAVAYVMAGAAPVGGNYAPAAITGHSVVANTIADAIPPTAGVSASSSLVPHLSHRARLYVFPAVLDADYVYVDLHASPAPTSAGDMYLRVQGMLASGDWQVARNEDGLLLLQRSPSAAPSPLDETSASGQRSRAAAGEATPRLLAASLRPGPDGAIGVDGPHWVLHTAWQTDRPLPSGTRLEFWITLRSGELLHAWDIAPLWWNPPDQWPANQPVTVDVPDVPVREFVSWSATWSTP